ncbi:MAG: hypothetical protein ACOZCO_06055 [Bacteroidota bacterium]
MEDKSTSKATDWAKQRTGIISPDLKVIVGKSELTVTYQPKTWRALYDLCDFSGNIIKKGELENLTSAINISELKNGSYSLWVVDGADLLKFNFTVNR